MFEGAVAGDIVNVSLEVLRDAGSSGTIQLLLDNTVIATTSFSSFWLTREIGPLTLSSSGDLTLRVSENEGEDVYIRNIDASISGTRTFKNPEVIQKDDYYPFGLTFNHWNQPSVGDENHYKYNGKEEQQEWGVIDYGARMYDGALGRFMNVDPHSMRYENISPYNYVNSNPINAIDPDGRDVILLVWATGNGGYGYGHAGIAVSNYKDEEYEVEENGKTVTKTRKVADGTYTYFDLWPGVDNDDDGVSDEIGSAGPNDAFTGPIAHYQIFDNLSLDDLIFGDPSGAEGKAADGVIQLNSGYEEDSEALSDIISYMKSNNSYTSILNNCSDLAACGVSEALDRYKKVIEYDSDEQYYLFNYTTPNGLYKYVRERISNNSNEGKELKNPGDVINTTFEEGVIERAKGN